MAAKPFKKILLAAYRTILSLILRGFFHLLYHQAAWTYDAVAWIVSAGHWQDWVSQARKFVRGERVLELGFGPGHLCLDLAREGFDTVGLDLSPQMCRRLNRKIEILKISGKLNGYAKLPSILRASGVEMPILSGTMDTVIATFPTEYIFFEKTARECYRVLRDGGRLVLLLSAYTTGETAAEKGSRLLFRWTGQEGVPAADWLAPYREAGFRIEVQKIELGHSQLTVLLGEKRAAD